MQAIISGVSPYAERKYFVLSQLPFLNFNFYFIVHLVICCIDRHPCLQQEIHNCHVAIPTHNNVDFGITVSIW
jgi:hypothetical protein